MSEGKRQYGLALALQGHLLRCKHFFSNKKPKEQAKERRAAADAGHSRNIVWPWKGTEQHPCAAKQQSNAANER